MCELRCGITLHGSVLQELRPGHRKEPVFVDAGFKALGYAVSSEVHSKRLPLCTAEPANSQAVLPDLRS